LYFRHSAGSGVSVPSLRSRRPAGSEVPADPERRGNVRDRELPLV